MNESVNAGSRKFLIMLDRKHLLIKIYLFLGAEEIDKVFISNLLQNRYDCVLNSEVARKVLNVNLNNRECYELLLQDNIPQFLENGISCLRYVRKKDYK